MNTKDVKLPLKTKLKVLFIALSDGSQGSFDIMATIISFGFGIFMASSTPLFLTNAVANVVLFIFLCIGYIIGLMAILIVAIKMFEDEILPSLESFMRKYNEIALPEKKKLIEEVDNILLKKKS